MSEQVIPGYELLQLLGEGGMGKVYKARQISLDRLVALKVLIPRLTQTSSDVERFKREAKATALLRHPHIVQVHDAGETDGTYYFAMEYIEGSNVADWVQKTGRLSEEDALIVAESVAQALAYAWQEAGLIHRDIKPDNLLVDKDGTIKIADLGLFKMVGSQGTYTIAGDVGCTPNYCSPEQAQGEPDLDCRSDMYSLGATLYHLVTGQVPFGQAEGTGPLVQHVTGLLEDPRTLVPDLRGTTAMLIRKLMAKSPADRYADWSLVLEDIRRVQKGMWPAQPLGEDAASTVKFMTTKKRAAADGVIKVDKGELQKRQSTVPSERPKPRSKLPVVLGIAAAVAVVLGLAIGIPASQRAKRRNANIAALSAAQAAFEEAESYARSHPSEYDMSVARYRSVSGRLIGSPYAQQAEQAIAVLEGQKKEAIARVLSDLATRATQLTNEKNYAAALETYRNYNGLLARETFMERTRLARELGELHNRLALQERLAREKERQEQLAKQAPPKVEPPPEPASPVKKIPVELATLIATLRSSMDVLDAQEQNSMTGIQDQYAKLLTGIEIPLRQKGDLDGVLAVKQEQQRFASERSVPDATPAGANLAIDQGQNTYRKQTAQTKLAYRQRGVQLLLQSVNALSAQQTKYVQSDRLDDALLVKTEIANVQTRLAALKADLDSLQARPQVTAKPETPPTPPVVSVQPPPKSPTVLTTQPRPPGKTQPAGQVLIQDPKGDYLDSASVKHPCLDIVEFAMKRKSADTIVLTLKMAGLLTDTRPEGNLNYLISFDLDMNATTGNSVRYKDSTRKSVVLGTGFDVTIVPFQAKIGGRWNTQVRYEGSAVPDGDVVVENTNITQDEITVIVKSKHFERISEFKVLCVSYMINSQTDFVPDTGAKTVSLPR